MKKYSIILGVILVAAVGAIGIQKGIVDKAEKLVREQEDKEEVIYSRPGFSNPMENVNNDSNWKTLYQNEFDALENPTECTGAHWDMQGEEMEDFVKEHLEKWGGDDWMEMESSLYNVGIDGNEETYYNLQYQWYKQKEEQDKDFMEVSVDKDAVSGRLHGVMMFIPFKEDAKAVFQDLMEKLGMETSESDRVFEEIYKNLKELGDNRNISYENNGFQIYMLEQDYTRDMKKDKKYYISIRPSE